MTTEVQAILDSFERLAEPAKRELASEILRRTLVFDDAPLSDDELAAIADETFLELDRIEAQDVKSGSR